MRARVRARAASCCGARTRRPSIGVSRATGWPLRVMMNSAPASTSRMQRANPWFASRRLIVLAISESSAISLSSTRPCYFQGPFPLTPAGVRVMTFGRECGGEATMGVIKRIAEFHDDVRNWRRDIHAHPELGFEEHRTSDFVARKLAEFGYEVHRGVGRTGVVGRLCAGTSQRSIGLRADMDALPIEEATNLAYRSRHQGRMHACGHDGHTAMLLGAARYLAETRTFDGTVNLIFQPAEEGLGGGEAMVKDGLFERFPCDAIFGMHNRPGLAVGKFAIRPGAMMAGGAFFDIGITGRGAHGARPESGIDPVVVAAHITTALQTIVARNVRPIDTAVLSVTQIHAGDAYNVIPELAVIRGTARAFAAETLQLIEDNMRRIAS